MYPTFGDLMKHSSVRTITFVAFSFARGGAGIAAQRFARLARAKFHVKCIQADRSPVDDLVVRSANRLEYFFHLFLRVISFLLTKLMRDEIPVKHSLNIFSARAVLKEIRRSQLRGELLNVHWINNDTLSLWQLARLPSGTVVTLHDEWLYHGAEHYSFGRKKYTRYVSGYDVEDDELRGLDWNQIVWRIKFRHFKNRHDLIFTVPSTWMLERAKESKLLAGKDVRLLPNPINTNHFYAFDGMQRAKARQELGIEAGVFVILAGAVKVGENEVKGFDIFVHALRLLREQSPHLVDHVRLLIFGGSTFSLDFMGFSVKSLGFVDGSQLPRIYNAADVCVVPSRVESFGQVAAESISCGTPVVCFRTSGLTDIVVEGLSGFLAAPFESQALADRISEVVSLPAEQMGKLRERCRKYAVEKFSEEVVLDAYSSIVSDAFEIRNSSGLH